MKLRIVNRPHSLRIRAWRNAGFPLSSLSYCSLSTMLLCADQDGETSPGLVCGPLVISGSRPRLRRAARHTGSAGHRGLAARHRRLATGHRLLVGIGSLRRAIPICAWWRAIAIGAWRGAVAITAWRGGIAITAWCAHLRV